VNRSAVTAALVPAAVVTATVTVPAACAGVTATICVLDTTVKLRAAVPPNVTFDAPPNAVPEIVTDVPPAVFPVVGESPVIAGFGAVT
jgi:hypothetical protein